MSQRYIPQDILDDARNAFACGVQLETLAGKLGVPEAHLRRLLKLPELEQSEPLATQMDLFAVDRLDAVL